MRGVILGCTVCLLVCFGGCAGLVAYLNKDLTRYAPGFTEAKFSSIKVGMTMAQVESILGQPLEKSEWRLFPAGPRENSGERDYAVYVNGRVVSGSPMLFDRGGGLRNSRQQAESLLKPAEMKIIRSEYRWSYAEPAWDLAQRYQYREVIFDGGGRVQEVYRNEWVD